MGKRPLGVRKRSAGSERKSARSPCIAPLPRIAGSPRSVRLPRIAKGRRPEFYEDPAIDQLFAIVTALTGEVSVLFDRLDSVERLLDAARILSTDAIEAYRPDASAAAVRLERRDELLRRVFAVLESYAARKAAPAS